MPRTEMFRFLRRTALDHAAAERAGMPVLEFREARLARAAGALSRRDVLRIGAAFGGAALVLGASRPARAVPVRKPAPRIAIVGAGIAGLTAALTMADAGIAATVFEAGDRVGGRMFSERDYWGGQTAEYGGEFIDTGHTAIRDLARRFGLPLTDVRDAAPEESRDLLFFGGRYRSHPQFVEDFRPVYKALRADLDTAGEAAPTWDSATPGGVALSRMSVEEWIATRVPGGYSTWIARFLDEAYTVEYGRETGEQTAVNLVYLMADQEDLANPNVWGASDERFRITGGNQRLPEAIAAALPRNAIQYGWRLEAIARDANGGQTLTFDGGRTVRADHTILTLPIGVLQRVDHTRAGFDPRMRAAISALRMGFCSKLHLGLGSRPWLAPGPWPGVSNGTTFADLGYQQTWDATAGQPGRKGIAVQYGGGEGALRFRPARPFTTNRTAYVRAAAARELAAVDEVVPGVRRAWTGRATLAAWHVNPDSLGAYSCYPVDYCHRYAGYEGTRQGNIHLAGEHTSADSQGYMNGGAESGARAAREVLADLA
ncbi:flavin monoamine oxidase family protein [Amycolatopsis anabasis]|uniref:flavin monoamine oxidase family protein n=1 Tax=Amycolatopsis anabasis TaxID=1840409 RepID=UPI001C550566|nr:NAD(P)/FAD-dependent oxidoreductase [Amycolatopsis anabasis]